MLVCPNCGFHNPNTNNFCQQCGQSLVYKTCEKCGERVEWSVLQCHNCSAVTGKTWWGIVSMEPNQKSAKVSEAREGEASAVGLGVPAIATARSSQTPERQESIDSQERLRISEESQRPPVEEADSEIAPLIPVGEADSEIAPLIPVGEADSETSPLAPTLASVETAGETPLASDTETIASASEDASSVSEAGTAEIEEYPEVSTAKVSEEKAAQVSEAKAAQVSEAKVSEAKIAAAKVSEEKAAQVSEEKVAAAKIAAVKVSEEKAARVLPEIAPGAYLDAQKRYQILEAIAVDKENGEIIVKVLDCQPLQQSPLFALMEAVQAGRDSDKTRENAMFGIPAIAQPYLALHSQFSAMPAVHDAWQENGLAVLLLEDRSDLPGLAIEGNGDRSEEIASELPPELSPELLWQWFDELARLWEAFVPWATRQSLLQLDNLRADIAGQGSLVLQRLYPEDSQDQPALASLGELWQELLNRLSRESAESEQLAQLVGDLRAGNLQTAAELRSRLEAIRPIALQKTENLPASKTTQIQITDGLDDFDDLGDLDELGDLGDDAPTMVLPLKLINLEAAGNTDIGRQRNHNEDDFLIETQVKKRSGSQGRSQNFRGLYIVADGMGGHEAGEVASAIAVETLREYFASHWPEEGSASSASIPSKEAIADGILAANQKIYDLNQQQQRSGSGRMGTTLAMALVQNTRVAVAHVGDSRLYLFSAARGLEQLTADHEVGQREIQQGIDPVVAYSRADAYQLTQALGPRNADFVSPDIGFINLEEDTLLIIGSDGLTDNDFLESNWETHLAPLLDPEADLERGVAQLIDLANERNGHDNITAIAIRVLVWE